MKKTILALTALLFLSNNAFADADANVQHTCYMTKEKLSQFNSLSFCAMQQGKVINHILIFTFKAKSKVIINDFVFHTPVGDFLPAWGKVEFEDVEPNGFNSSYIVKIQNDMLSALQEGEKFSFVYTRDGKANEIVLTDDQYVAISLTAAIR